jgi:hypothetical protein
MSLDEARNEIGVTDADLARIRATKDPNWLLRGIITLAVAISSFVMGYALGSRYSSSDSYPYASLGIPVMLTARKTRVPWLFVAILAVISFAAFSIGVYASGGPSLGVATYYGVFSREG